MLNKISFFLLLFVGLYFYLQEEQYTNNTILVGSSLPKTGIIKEWGLSVNTGANAYFNYVNEFNILNNKKIKLISYDDKYEPELTIENINKLIYEDKVFSLFGFVGTPTVKSILPIATDADIPFIAPFTGASFLREINDQNFINFRSSYAQEIERLLVYLHERKKLNKIAVFYQNDNYGEEGYISLLKSLKKRNLTLSAEGTYKRNTLSISHAYHEIKDVKPQAVIMIGAYKANALFIQKAKQDENFKDTIFCNISFGDADAMIEDLNKETENLIFSQVVPSYTDTSIEVIKEYQKLMKRYYPNEKLGFISLEAFLAAKTVVSALLRVQGVLTKEKFLTKLKKTPPNILKGLTLEYKNSQLLNKVYLFEYKNNKFIEINYDF